MVIIISYNKQTWKEYNDNQTAHKNLANGAIISADKLNHMETGISNNDINKVTDNKNGSIQVNGSSITPADDSKVVHTADTSNWQKQAMFNPGNYVMDATSSNTDFATLLRSKYNKPGVVYIRDNTSFVDAVVICEGNGWWHAYGAAGDGNFVHRLIRTTDDTGWVINADDSKVVHSKDMRKPASEVAGIEEVNTKQDKISYTPADDSKVVHSKDMRKPASDVAGIEEVNAKQDKIGYTTADDSKVWHTPLTQLNSTDMNTVLTAGFYHLISGTNGMPNADYWTIYQVIPWGSTNGVQIAFQTNNTILGMRSWNNYNHFTSWVQFADDSKVVHTTDMRKPANDVAGIEEVNALQTQVDNSAVGTNLAIGTNQEYLMGYGISTTTWKDGYAYEKLPTTVYNGEILPQGLHGFWYTLTQGVTYTQTIWFETDATVKNLSAVQITWYTGAVGHDAQPAIVQKLGQNSYRVVSAYTWPGKSDNNVRLFDIQHLDSAFDLSTGTYLKFGKLKLEKGSVATDWCPNPEDKVNVSDMRKPASDVAGIEEVNVKQDKIGYTPANDSKVVHKDSNTGNTSENVNFTGKVQKDNSDLIAVSDMRKPASDVAGIEEVNAKQDKIGYTPADNSTVLHNNDLDRITTDDSGIVIGNEQNFGLIKRIGSPAGIAIGSGKNFRFMATNDAVLSNKSGYHDVWNIAPNGQMSIMSGAYFTPADDSKVVHNTDMRKPASDVVGLEDASTSVYQSQLAPGTDIHKVTKDGLYPLGWTYVNFIDSHNHWGTLQVINNNAIIIHIARIEGTIWFETRSGSPELWHGWHKLSSDDEVAHLSGANNFDTIPTVNNNPLLLASSLPSDLARTGSNQEFTGKNTFDIAPIDKTTGNPYITKDGVPKVDLSSYATNNQLATKADDSKVVHTTDMRKPANDVAGIEEVNVKQDKIGYTPANDSKVVHNSGNEEIAGQKTFDTAPIDKTTGNPYITKSDLSNELGTKVTDNKDELSTKVTDNKDNTITANNVKYDLSKTGLTPIGFVNSGSFNDLPLGTVMANATTMTDGPTDTNHGYTTTTFYSSEWGGRKAQIAIADNANLMYFRIWIGTSWNSWVLLSDDSKVVHTADMRKPASDVAGIEEVNAKQDKIGYTPADDSKVVHSTTTELNSTDMNTVLTAGFYRLASGTNGMPIADEWTIYQVIPLADSNGVQIAYQTNHAILGMRSWNCYNKFTDWVQFADDSKVVHTADMRKPASNVVGLEDVPQAVVHSALTSGVDLDTIWTPGVYPFSAVSFTNYIDNATYWGYLVVISEGGIVTQTVHTTGPAQPLYRIQAGSPAKWGPWVRMANDYSVAHLSGANNFDTVPTVNNNPLLLASSLPSDLARTGSNQEFTGKNTFDTAPIDKTTGNPYITKDGVPAISPTLADTTKDANFTGKLQKSGIDVATTTDVTKAVGAATANMVDSSKLTNFTRNLQQAGSDVITQAKWVESDSDSNAQSSSTSDPEGFYYTEVSN